MNLGMCLDGLQLDGPVFIGLATAAGLGLLLVWVLRNEEFAGRHYFVATISAMVVWLTLGSAELATSTLSCKVAMASATWPAITLAPVAWSLFIWHFSFNRLGPENRWIVGGVIALVIVISAAALTNPLHQLVYGPATALVYEGGRLSAQFDHGPLFFAAAVVLYAFLLTGFIIATLVAFRATRSIRPIMMTMSLATAVPMVANLSYIFMGTTIFGFDPSPCPPSAPMAQI